MSLSACSTVSKPHVIKPHIPAAFLEPCAVYDIAISTVGDLVESRERYRLAYEECAAKVDALRAHSGDLS